MNTTSLARIDILATAGRRAVLAAVVVSLAVALGACGDKTTVNTAPVETTGITVSGHGEVQIPPDIGFLTIGVQSIAPTVAEARERAATSATAVIDAIKGEGVEAKDIQTVGLSIYPNYDYQTTPGNPRITGYTVSNTVVAKVRDLDSMSAVIDGAVSAAGDDSRLQGISFGIDDQTVAKEQAREAAMADAKAKAEQLARLGGVTLGAPATISETAFAVSYPEGGSYRSISGDDSATPIEIGTNTVSVDVSVRYFLQ